jgi:LysR family hydrogen peroxide-inducible transcriptional activator
LQQAKYSVTDGLTLENHSLAIGMIPTLAPYILHDAVLAFQKRYPGTELSITEDVTEKLVEALLKTELDICYVSLPIKNKQISTEALFTEPLRVAVSARNPLAQNLVVGTASLENSPFIMLHDEHCLSDQIEAFCYIQQIDPHVLYKTSQLATALEFVRLDIGIALVPACAAFAYPHDDIRFLSIEGQSPERVIVAASHAGRAASQPGARFTSVLQAAWQRAVHS